MTARVTRVRDLVQLVAVEVAVEVGVDADAPAGAGRHRREGDLAARALRQRAQGGVGDGRGARLVAVELPAAVEIAHLEGAMPALGRKLAVARGRARLE